jgi:hypothetical protein
MQYLAIGCLENNLKASSSVIKLRKSVKLVNSFWMAKIEKLKQTYCIMTTQGKDENALNVAMFSCFCGM